MNGCFHIVEYPTSIIGYAVTYLYTNKEIYTATYQVNEHHFIHCGKEIHIETQMIDSWSKLYTDIFKEINE